MVGPEAADEDVGGGDDFAKAQAGEKESGEGERQAVGEGEGGEAEGGEEVTGEDPEAQFAGNGRATDEGADEFGEEKKTAALIGELPVVEELRQQGSEDDGAEAGQQKARGEDGRGRAGVGPGSLGWRCLLGEGHG